MTSSNNWNILTESVKAPIIAHTHLKGNRLMDIYYISAATSIASEIVLITLDNKSSQSTPFCIYTLVVCLPKDLSLGTLYGYLHSMYVYRC